MKRHAQGTDQDGILDEGYLHHGGELGWSVFGDGRMGPAELVAMFEEGVVDVDGERAMVLGIMLDLVLAGWPREVSVGRVGERAVALAAALVHWAGRGVRMPGARREVGGAGRLEIARRILDFWFLGRPGVEDVGKRLVAIGKFLNHAALDGWSLTRLGLACGETPAGMMERVRRVCNGPIEAAGGKGKATWQQGEAQREQSAVAQLRRADNLLNNKTKNHEQHKDGEA